ncbi:hypothetical protein H4R33_000844 [Dimargaris cristalligena]|nr:hypothetical protein H4R33_000844 [Dimargaris cristalligena]
MSEYQLHQPSLVRREPLFEWLPFGWGSKKAKPVEETATVPPTALTPAGPTHEAAELKQPETSGNPIPPTIVTAQASMSPLEPAVLAPNSPDGIPPTPSPGRVPLYESSRGSDADDEEGGPLLDNLKDPSSDEPETPSQGKSWGTPSKAGASDQLKGMEFSPLPPVEKPATLSTTNGPDKPETEANLGSLVSLGGGGDQKSEHTKPIVDQAVDSLALTDSGYESLGDSPPTSPLLDKVATLPSESSPLQDNLRQTQVPPGWDNRGYADDPDLSSDDESVGTTVASVPRRLKRVAWRDPPRKTVRLTASSDRGGYSGDEEDNGDDPDNSVLHLYHGSEAPSSSNPSVAPSSPSSSDKPSDSILNQTIKQQMMAYILKVPMPDFMRKKVVQYFEAKPESAPVAQSPAQSLGFFQRAQYRVLQWVMKVYNPSLQQLERLPSWMQGAALKKIMREKRSAQLKAEVKAEEEAGEYNSFTLVPHVLVDPSPDSEVDTRTAAEKAASNKLLRENMAAQLKAELKAEDEAGEYKGFMHFPHANSDSISDPGANAPIEVASVNSDTLRPTQLNSFGIPVSANGYASSTDADVPKWPGLSEDGQETKRPVASTPGTIQLNSFGIPVSANGYASSTDADTPEWPGLSGAPKVLAPKKPPVSSPPSRSFQLNSLGLPMRPSDSTRPPMDDDYYDSPGTPDLTSDDDSAYASEQSLMSDTEAEVNHVGIQPEPPTTKDSAPNFHPWVDKKRPSQPLNIQVPNYSDFPPVHTTAAH